MGALASTVAFCWVCGGPELALGAAPPPKHEVGARGPPFCNSSDEEENVRRAYGLAKARQWEDAMNCLRRAAYYFPYVPAIHRDFGRAAIRVARRAQAGWESSLRECPSEPGDGGSSPGCASSAGQRAPEAAEAHREACAALWLAQLLGDADAGRHRKHCEEPTGVVSQEGNTLDSDAQALLRLRGKRSQRVADLEAIVATAVEVCGGPEGAAVPVSAEEARKRRLRSTTLLAALVRLEVCGLVELRGPVLAAEVLASVATSQRSALDELLAAGGADGSGAVERWKSRFEAQVPMARPFTEEALVGSPLLLQLVRLALGPRVEVDTFSHVTALAGAPEQPWHTDVDLLFKEPGALDAGHHPAAGLVAVVPLQNLTQELGPTEFLAGSHAFAGEGAWEQFQNPEVEVSKTVGPPRLRPLPSLGSVVLFDLRVHHHGTANRADVPRSILYLSYVKDWFLDRLNFRGRQSSAFDGLGSSRMKKLLRRVDARSYIDGLEAFAAGRADAPPGRARPFREPDLSI